MTSEFQLVQLSDPHIGASWADRDPAATLAASVDAVLRLHDRVDAVLVSGDLTEDGAPADYRTLARELARLPAPVHVIAGNHDDRDALRDQFGLAGAPGDPVQYAAELGPLRLVALDSTRAGSAAGELDGERLAWLDAELARAAAVPTIVAVHHPPLATGSEAWDAIGLPARDRRALAAVLARHPQVARVVSGHIHMTIVSSLAGRPVLAAPSTYVQAELDLGAPRIAFGDEPPAFAVHALAGGELASYVRSVPW